MTVSQRRTSGSAGRLALCGRPESAGRYRQDREPVPPSSVESAAGAQDLAGERAFCRRPLLGGAPLAADVDPALVYHCYASKEGLLDAATTPPQSFLDQIITAWQTPRSELGEHLVRQMLRNWDDPRPGAILRAVLQIAGNVPATRDKLRGLIERSIMGPSASALSEPERLERSSLVASQLLGVAFMRYVWQIEPLATMTEQEIVAAIAPNIQRYLSDDLARPGIRAGSAK